VKVDDEIKEHGFALPGGSGESKKRRRELLFVILISFLFLLLTWFQIRLFGISKELPFVHSIFFFGLVNFNIILLLLLLFLIFRNVVKVFVERRGKIIGSSLKAKLIAAFVAFSFIPTVLMFLISVFYINSSFDKWFSVKMAGVLKSSLEVTNAYYFNAKKRNYHFANEVAKQVGRLSSERQIRERLKELRQVFSLDAVEYYPGLFEDRIVAISSDQAIARLPALSLEFLQKGIKTRVEASTIHQFGEGNLVRVIVPVDEKMNRGAIVVSSYVPLSLISKMNDISSAYEDFRDVNPLEYPLKSIYTIILFFMTLVILIAATWFGFYLAKQLSIPLVMVGRATRRVAEGDYSEVSVQSGSEEIAELVKSFNLMTMNLAKSEKEISQAQENLEITLENLDKHSRYVEVVLANVSTGVMAVDPEGIVTTLNRKAGQLLNVDPSHFVGRHTKELFSRENYRTILEILKTMQDRGVDSIQKEVAININGQTIPLQVTLSSLRDERGIEVGRILVFDDLTPIVNAQRAAAWTEVARRIAHEIKNPLTPIKLSAERLQRKFGAQVADGAFAECTSMIIKQTDELRRLVNEFSQFARLPEARKVLASLNEVIEEALVLYRSGHSQHHIEFKPDGDLPEFKIDPEQIKRVIGNLVDNALHAVPEGTKAEVVLETRFNKTLKLVTLTVSDNGEGISPEYRQRVFDPYYSTKTGGTGLGLSIVKRIVEDHDGFIRAQGNEPRGVRMVIELPVITAGRIQVSSRSDS
jgi:two-component system nitrogen regulation sensor histidine kinase NtrY